MVPLYEDPEFTFRFADDRIIPRFHLECVEAGRRVEVYKIDPGTGERLGLLAMATVGEAGWVDLAEPIIVRAGEGFIAVPKRDHLPRPGCVAIVEDERPGSPSAGDRNPRLGHGPLRRQDRHTHRQSHVDPQTGRGWDGS